MAIEVRLGDDALSRRTSTSASRLKSPGGRTPEDMFVLTAGPVMPSMEDGAGRLTWRSKVASDLAGMSLRRGPFRRLASCVRTRPDRGGAAPQLTRLRRIESPAIEGSSAETGRTSQKHGHHKLLKDFGDRENSGRDARRPDHPRRARAARHEMHSRPLSALGLATRRHRCAPAGLSRRCPRAGRSLRADHAAVAHRSRQEAVRRSTRPRGGCRSESSRRSPPR